MAPATSAYRLLPIILSPVTKYEMEPAPWTLPSPEHIISTSHIDTAHYWGGDGTGSFGNPPSAHHSLTPYTTCEMAPVPWALPPPEHIIYTYNILYQPARQ